MSKETFFSIILPVYNAESTIFRSITSVLNQNYNNFELIIINDASTDKTSKICKKFKNNKNIKFLNNRKNLGVSKSRNKAIKYATGKYIIFLDSDDYFLEKFLFDLNKLTINKSHKIIVANNIFIKKKISNKKLFIELFKKNKLSYFCWNYIVNRDYLMKKKMFFNDLKVFEDHLFVLKLLTSIKRCQFFRKKFIVRNETFGSLGRLTNYQSAFSYLKNLFEINKLRKKIKNKIMYNFLSKRFDEYKNYLKLYSLILNQKEKNLFAHNCVKMINPKKNYKFFLEKINIHQKENRTIFINMIDKTNTRNRKSVYLYSASRHSRILIKLLNIKFIKVIDQNINFIGKNLFGIKILSSKKFIKFQNKVLFVPRNINVKKKILLKIGFKKEDIKFYSFNLKTNLFDI